MNIKKLNEELDKLLINEISDELRQRYISGREKQRNDIAQQIRDLKKKQKKLDQSIDKQSTIYYNNLKGARGEKEKRLFGKVGDTEIYRWQTTVDRIRGKLAWVSNYVEGNYSRTDDLERAVYIKLANELTNNKQPVAIDSGLWNIDLEAFLCIATKAYCGEKIGSGMANMFNNIFHKNDYTIPDGFERLEDITDPIMKSLVLLSSVRMDEGYHYTEYGDYESELFNSRNSLRESRIHRENDKLILDIRQAFPVRDEKKIKYNPDNENYIIIAELPLDSINLPSVSLPPKDLIDCCEGIEVDGKKLVEISPKYLQLLDYTKTIYEQRQKFVGPFQEKMKKLVNEWLAEHLEEE